MVNRILAVGDLTGDKQECTLVVKNTNCTELSLSGSIVVGSG